jgi:hypothetical protein
MSPAGLRCVVVGVVFAVQDIISQMRSHHLQRLGRFGEGLLEKLKRCLSTREVGNSVEEGREFRTTWDVEAQVSSRWHSASTIQFPSQLTNRQKQRS